MKILIKLLSTVLVPIIFLSIGKAQNLEFQNDPNEGTHLEFIIHSPSLEDNFLGDSPERWVSVYLPPGYYSSPDKQYPVIYILHSYTGDHTEFFGGTEWTHIGVNFKTICDSLIETGEIDSMIVVSPNTYNKYWGSFYRNSIVTGNWADFIVEDVIHYIDNNFRTLPQKESRGLCGHSMGGSGTIWLVMNYPDVYNSAYMFSGDVSIEDLYLGSQREYLMEAACAESLEGLDWDVVVCIALAAAIAPDTLAPPFYAQFPLDCSGETIDSIMQKWLQQDPLTLVPSFKDSIMQLQAIQFDVGSNDAYAGFIYGNRKLSEAFNNAGIPHVFEEHDGRHSDKLAERIVTKLLPFFSEYLSDTMITDTSFYNLIEWQGFEAKENYRLNEKIKLDTLAWNSDSVSYKIISGNPDNIFSIDNNTREILADSLTLDYEEKTYHNLLVRATYQNEDERINDSANFFIRIENINDNAPVAHDTIFYIEETLSVNRRVGYVKATDIDGNLFDFVITDGNINETFSIDNSGLIRVANAESLDYESIPQFLLSVIVTETDGPFSDTAIVTINLEDVVESIKTHELKNKITIHPNPAYSSITIETGISDIHNIEITSLNGQLIFRKQMEGTTHQIDLSSFEKGLYLIRISNAKYTVTEKIIKVE